MTCLQQYNFIFIKFIRHLQRTKFLYSSQIMDCNQYQKGPARDLKSNLKKTLGTVINIFLKIN